MASGLIRTGGKILSLGAVHLLHAVGDHAKAEVVALGVGTCFENGLANHFAELSQYIWMTDGHALVGMRDQIRDHVARRHVAFRECDPARVLAHLVER
jgi:hypothetical protein